MRLLHEMIRFWRWICGRKHVVVLLPPVVFDEQIEDWQSDIYPASSLITKKRRGDISV